MLCRFPGESALLPWEQYGAVMCLLIGGVSFYFGIVSENVITFRHCLINDVDKTGIACESCSKIPAH